MKTLGYDILHQKQLEKSLSGNQVDFLLNYFLTRSLEPIVQTLWFKNEICLLINQGVRVLKNKISNKTQFSSIAFLYSIIGLIDREAIFSQLKLASLDRSFLQEIINNFLLIYEKVSKLDISFYKELNDGILNVELGNEINNAEEYFQGLSYNFIIKAGKKVQYWFEKYLELKNLIAGKYYLLACKYAKITKVNHPSIDYDCLFKSLILSIDTALDKYSCEKGTLASYIQMWFQSTLSNPKYDYELGKAFSIPTYGKKKLKGSNLLMPAISIESEDFQGLENFVEPKEISPILDFEQVDTDLLEFLNSIEDNNVDLVRIVLNIPQLKENCK